MQPDNRIRMESSAIHFQLQEQRNGVLILYATATFVESLASTQIKAARVKINEIRAESARTGEILCLALFEVEAIDITKSCTLNSNFNMGKYSLDGSFCYHDLAILTHNNLSVDWQFSGI
jgi:hypothetical protein